MALSLTLGGLWRSIPHVRAAFLAGARWTWAVAFAVLIGVGVATKVTFVPLIVVPLFILPGGKTRSITARPSASPSAWQRSRSGRRTISPLLSLAGGRGDASRLLRRRSEGLTPEYVVPGLKRLALGEVALLYVTLAAAAYSLLRPLLRRRSADEAAAAPVSWYLLALLAAMAGQFLMEAGHSLPRCTSCRPMD